jgi:four helix bundle protein
MLQIRTYELARRTVGFCIRLYEKRAIRPLVYQLLRSGTSSAANYRAAMRARSRSEFVSKSNLVLEEADEAKSWCELFRDTNVSTSPELDAMISWADEVVAAASKFTVRQLPRSKPTSA